MESTKAKVEVMKPVLLKAGIPLAISVAGFIYARFMVRKSAVPRASSLETKVNSLETNSQKEFRDEESFQSLISTSSLFKEDEEDMITSTQFINLVESSQIQDKTSYEEEILGLRSRIEGLRKRELDLEMQFLGYRVLKEHESVLVELSNMSLLEIAHIEFLERQISSMEAEKKRFENLVVEYVRVLQQLDNWKSENGLLQRKVKNLLRKTKDQSHTIREQNLKIEAREAEVLRNCNSLERMTNVIKKLEDEARELRMILDQLQEEKNELSEKLISAEKSASSSSKNEGEGITKEDYNQLVNELEQLRKERAAELRELIYLRWSNACLRHELLRSREQQEQNQESKNNAELEYEGSGEIEEHGMEHHLDGLALEHGDSCLGATTGSHVCSKRPKLLQKFKRWVEGSDKIKPKYVEKGRHDVKCFGRHSVSD